MKVRAIALALVSCVLIGNSSVASAATKPVKVIAIKPLKIGTLSGATGDDISSALLTNAAVVLVGTAEGNGGGWITSPALGGTDGFITELDFSGTHLWDLRLGNSGDEIATDVAKDSLGSLWVVGAVNSLSAPSASPTPSTTPLNPDGVSVDPAPAANLGLTQLTVWKVSRAGQLLATYSLLAPAVINPQHIRFDGSANFMITGQIAAGASAKNFSVSLDASGSFGVIVQNKLVVAKPLATLIVPAGINNWRIFTSSSAIAGIPSWAPKKATLVAISYSKAGRVLAANSMTGKLRFALWARTPGLVLITEQSTGFGLTIVTPLAG